MTERVRPYLFYDVAISVCRHCYRKVEGKIIFQDEKVFLVKHCLEHGWQKVLISDDVEYYRRSREVFIKTPEMPLRYNTPVKWGCPYDCGLCTDHEQHSCLSLIEITDHCNLSCPICYAESSPHRNSYRSLEQIERMLDAVVANEGEPDVVQISGGEPTLHPEFFKILNMAKERPIKHLMLNTNGLRLAKEESFVERLASYMPGFEVYLQFDSLKQSSITDLRGADLLESRFKAIEHLNRYGLSTNLVVTLKKDLNDDEIGEIIDFALKQNCVRGITFQPIQEAGRTQNFNSAANRLTLSEVRRRILEQCDLFKPEDILPVPCHPDSLAMAYALKLEDKVVPLTGMIDPKVLIEGGRNSIVYEKDDMIKDQIFKLFATNHSPKSGELALKDLLCCLPKVQNTSGLGYQNIFRIIIMQFIDADNFDVRSVKKSCVHIVHPKDGRLIPFDTYNLFYRDDLEETRLKPLRDRVEEV